MRTRMVVGMTALAAAIVSGCASGYGSKKTTYEREVVRPKGPDQQVAQPPAPRLDPGQPERTATELIEWAAASTLDQREAVRAAVKEIRDSETVLRALCGEAFEGRSVDHSRTLIALALIGETRSDAGERCLTEFVQLPFPTSGHDVQGEIVEQTDLGTLQAKAVDGLAYRRTDSADRLVLHLMRDHPSRIVRAEAISAYLWNREDSAQAKAELAGVVRPDERIFIDRVRRIPGETAATFNPKLRAFLDKYPETRAAAPEKGEGRHPVVCPANCVTHPGNQTAPSSGRKGE